MCGQKMHSRITAVILNASEESTNTDPSLTLRMTRFLLCTLITTIIFSSSPRLSSALTVEELDQKLSDRSSTFYREFFDQVVYYPISIPLRWDRWISRFHGRESLNVNIFDEIADSSFFKNRHGRKLMSIQELVAGPNLAGPDAGPWTVVKGKDDGYQIGFFIKDKKGDRYLLKFDPIDHPEMSTAAEIIGHKFFYAFGYHVPQYNLVHFKPEDLVPDPKATYYNSKGFKKPLTREAILELLQKISMGREGRYRAVASRILEGKAKGWMSFEGVRKGDPEDLIPHEDRRELRALRVFASWINHYDLRPQNTLDVIVEENGETFVKHYLIDFGSTLGSAGSHVKWPAAVHESIIDWSEIGEAIMVFKFDYKSWERRWDQNQRQVVYPAIGYFDNLKFKPQRWTSQLHHEVFKRVTEADGYWAAKTISKFSNAMIESLVKTGEISDKEAEAYLIKTLIERRDMVTRYWFSQVVPLENIKVESGTNGTAAISFIDLAAQSGFETASDVRYRFKVGKGAWKEFSGNSIEVTTASNLMTISIEKKSPSQKSWGDRPIRLTIEKSAQSNGFRLVGIQRGR